MDAASFNAGIASLIAEHSSVSKMDLLRVLASQARLVDEQVRAEMNVKTKPQEDPKEQGRYMVQVVGSKEWEIAMFVPGEGFFVKGSLKSVASWK